MTKKPWNPELGKAHWPVQGQATHFKQQQDRNPDSPTLNLNACLHSLLRLQM